MDLHVKLLGNGGHTEIQFADGEAVLEWRETSLKERQKLVAMTKSARDGGFIVHCDGKKFDEEIAVAFFARSGRIILRNEDKTAGLAVLGVIAKGLIDHEIKNGKLVLELLPSNEWKIVKLEEFEPSKSKKVVTSDKPVGG